MNKKQFKATVKAVKATTNRKYVDKFTEGDITEYDIVDALFTTEEIEYYLNSNTNTTTTNTNSGNSGYEQIVEDIYSNIEQIKQTIKDIDDAKYEDIDNIIEDITTEIRNSSYYANKFIEQISDKIDDYSDDIEQIKKQIEQIKNKFKEYQQNNSNRILRDIEYVKNIVEQNKALRKQNKDIVAKNSKIVEEYDDKFMIFQDNIEQNTNTIKILKSEIEQLKNTNTTTATTDNSKEIEQLKNNMAEIFKDITNMKEDIVDVKNTTNNMAEIVDNKLKQPPTIDSNTEIEISIDGGDILKQIFTWLYSRSIGRIVDYYRIRKIKKYEAIAAKFTIKAEILKNKVKK